MSEVWHKPPLKMGLAMWQEKTGVKLEDIMIDTYNLKRMQIDLKKIKRNQKTGPHATM